MSDQTSTATIHWNVRLEEYFAHTGEKAHCYSWLHKKAEEMYSTRSVWIDLPVIILGTLNGAISVGSDSLFNGSQYSSVAVGVVALMTAILSTIGSYFAWSRRAEGHRISALNYAKLYRFLSIEMSLPRMERMTPNDLLKYVKTEYDRLSEISPLIPQVINEMFRKRFSDTKYDDISKPEDTNGLHPIHIYPLDDSILASVAPKSKSPLLLTDIANVVESSSISTGDLKQMGSIVNIAEEILGSTNKNIITTVVDVVANKLTVPAVVLDTAELSLTFNEPKSNDVIV